MKEHRFTLIELIILIVLIGILVVAFVGSYLDINRPTIELKKSDLECVKSENRMYLQHILIGKITALTTGTISVCVEYARRAEITAP